LTGPEESDPRGVKEKGQDSVNKAIKYASTKRETKDEPKRGKEQNRKLALGATNIAGALKKQHRGKKVQRL